MAEINNLLDEQQEKIRQLNEKIQKIYRKHFGFIIKKEMEFNNNRSKNEDNNKTNLISEEKADIDKEDEENEHNNNPPIAWNSNLTQEFIEECVENEIRDNDNNSNNDAIKLSKDMREQLKKQIEVYEQLKKVQREAVFYDL